MVVQTADDTGNIDIEINTFKKILTNNQFTNLNTLSPNHIVNLNNTVVAHSPQFRTRNDRIMAITQPNSIWLPEIALETILTGLPLIEGTHHINVAQAIYMLAKTYDVTTTEQLMAHLNDCTVEVDYITDLLKMKSPTIAPSNRRKYYVDRAICTYNNQLDNVIENPKHNYFQFIYQALVDPTPLDNETLIKIYQSVIQNKDNIPTQWHKFIDLRMKNQSTNAFGLDGDIQYTPSSELIYEFSKALLQTANGDIFDIFFENINEHFKRRWSSGDKLLEMDELTKNPQIIEYIIEHELPITVKINLN